MQLLYSSTMPFGETGANGMPDGGGLPCLEKKKAETKFGICFEAVNLKGGLPHFHKMKMSIITRKGNYCYNCGGPSQ